MGLNPEAVQKIAQKAAQSNDFLARLLAADFKAQGVTAEVVESEELTEGQQAKSALQSENVATEAAPTAVVAAPAPVSRMEIKEVPPKPPIRKAIERVKKEELVRFPLPMFSTALMMQMNQVLTGLPISDKYDLPRQHATDGVNFLIKKGMR